MHTEYSLTGRRITHQPATGGILNEPGQSSIEAFHRRFPNHFNCKLNGGRDGRWEGFGPQELPKSCIFIHFYKVFEQNGVHTQPATGGILNEPDQTFSRFSRIMRYIGVTYVLHKCYIFVTFCVAFCQY